MLNINLKLQTRLATVLVVVMSAMFILTGCGLGSLIKAVSSGNIPCNLNPFQPKCYPDITVQIPDKVEKIVLTEEEINTLTPEELTARVAEITAQNEAIERQLAERDRELAKRQAELDRLAPVRKKLIDPVVAECTTNSVAEHCRNAFVWCSNFENTNSDECENAVGADTGLFACLTDPYRDECEGEPALKEEIKGRVVVRDKETGDVMLDDNGEEITEEKTVSLLENTIQARINYCRSDNDAGVPNIEANKVLCDSTVREVCDDPANPSGVFDVFCTTPDHAQKQLQIATACRDDEALTLADGCTSVVNFCNASPFGNSNCNIDAFAPAREARVMTCINASTTKDTNDCGVELANNPCFGDPFTDSVDCEDELNLGSAANVKTAQQNRSVLCVNAFIAKTYPDICGGAVAEEPCVTDPFGACADGLGTEGQTSARQVRALYCVIGTKTEDPLCAGIQAEPCFIDPARNDNDYDCTSFFGDAPYTFIDAEGATKTGTQQDRAQNQRGAYCATFLQTEGRTETTELCEATIVRYCETGQNLFSDSDRAGTPACLSRKDFDDKRLQFANECRAGTRTEGCAGGVVSACNTDPFASYQTREVPATATTARIAPMPLPNFCAGDHFDGARADKITACLASGATGCTPTFRHPNAATWVQSFRDASETLVALDTSTPKNQFLLGTADGIPTTGTNATATTLTIANDAKNGVGFFTANTEFYAGLFNGANLGAPLDDATQAGEWTGSLQAVVGSSATDTTVLPMTLTVTYTGSANTIKAFVIVPADVENPAPSSDNHFLLDGTFTANGVMSGTVNYGVFTGGLEGTPAENRGTNGILTGLIGQVGALGAFHSTATGTNGYAGGFVATK